LHFLNPQNSIVEIGFTLSHENQGFGYGSEAVKSIIYFLFKILKKHRIFASVDPQNNKSISLLKRVGFKQEAYFKKSLFIKENWVDDVIFALLNEEYQPNEEDYKYYCIKE
ncbi:MAG TPA: GNAT family protein, partial [Candidatus Wallbacteria bacterium]|nr:GNAT family protein [Candidatus Wallbacteria bacterium]